MKISIPYGQRFSRLHSHVLQQIANRTLAERIRQRYLKRLALAPVLDDRVIIEVVHRGGVIMGFARVNTMNYRLLVFSQDYMLYKSDSSYNLDTWRCVLENCGVEDWEIEEALGKTEDNIL